MAFSYAWRSVGLALAFAISAPSANAAPRPGAAEIVVDAGSGRVLHARGADRLRRPASIAKVMTLFLVFDAIDAGKLRLDQRLTVSRRAASQVPTRLGLRPGATLTVRQAMRAVAVKSANDAAVVLAEALAVSERGFAERMTAKARKIGMKDTVFGNASGLPDKRTWTTARDIATLARAILKAHPDRYALFGRRTLQWNDRSWPNHNHLLSRRTGVDGIKTGYTDEAGYTLAASAKRNGRRLIAVALGFRSWQARDGRVGALLETGFADMFARAEPRRQSRATRLAQAAEPKRPIEAKRGAARKTRERG